MMNPFSRKGPEVPPPPSDTVARPSTDSEIVANAARLLSERIVDVKEKLESRLEGVCAPKNIELPDVDRPEPKLTSPYFNGVYIDIDSSAMYLDEIEDLIARLAI